MFAVVQEPTAGTDVLVLAAHAVELEGLPPMLRQSAPDEARAPLVQRGPGRVSCAAIGVGLTAAGAGAAKAVIEHAPRAVVLIGSFGRYPQSTLPCSPEAAYVAERVRLVDGTVAQHKGALPAPMPVELVLDRSLSVALAQSGAQRMALLGTTLSITTDDALARLLGQSSGCDGENLEALAVAHACALAHVPLAILVACTNEVGSQGRSGWLASHAEAARSTARVLEAFLQARAAR